MDPTFIQAVSSPKNRPGEYANGDTLFLFGLNRGELASSPRFRKHAGAEWKRTLADAGMEYELSRVEVSLDSLPDDRIAYQVVPDSTRVGFVSIALDLTAALASQFKEAWEADARFERASDRWRKTPDRVRGYVPADAGSIRWTLLPRTLFDGTGYDRQDVRVVDQRVAAVECAAWAYMATPHFIPAPVARDVVTAVPPPPQALAEARLPQRYVMVFHDGIPLADVIAADGGDPAPYADSKVLADNALLLGALLSAEDDGTVYERCAYLIVARRASHSGGYGWSGVRVAYGDHPAGRILANYVALLSWEGWAAPPPLPTPKDGKRISGNQLKKIAKSVAGRNGAWHRVRVLAYRPPADDELPPEPRPRGGGQGRQRRHAGWRRGYWTTRKRYGIRDAHDRLVGPVYGPDAIEGVTFERRRRFVRPTVTRPDLPPPPGNEVYRLPGTIQPEQKD